MQPPDLRHRLVAIMEADGVGYSRLMSIDERATVGALDAARDVFGSHIAAQGGRVIDMAGDSVLAVFETATGAVSAGLAVQQQLGEAVSTCRKTVACAFALASISATYSRSQTARCTGTA